MSKNDSFFYLDQIVLAGQQLKEAEKTIERFEGNLKKLKEFSYKFKNSAEIDVFINVEARDKNDLLDTCSIHTTLEELYSMLFSLLESSYNTCIEAKQSATIFANKYLKKTEEEKEKEESLIFKKGE